MPKSSGSFCNFDKTDSGHIRALITQQTRHVTPPIRGRRHRVGTALRAQFNDLKRFQTSINVNKLVSSGAKLSRRLFHCVRDGNCDVMLQANLCPAGFGAKLGIKP